LEIVRPACRYWSERSNIALETTAIERAWTLQRRFATEGSPIGRTIDFIRRTLRRAAEEGAVRLESHDIVDSFCRDTGMPAVLLRDDRVLNLEVVSRQLALRVMGQARAIDKVVDVVGVTKAGLSAADRPLGSFLFVGPTGVGKTELARALAQFLFGHEERLIRLDMSEYAQLDGYSRLIGEGSREGDLTAPVRRQPFCVLLLDEIEKAHANVFDLLLQVLGEARLTDAQGRTTRFQNTIIIMTSNLGVESLKPAMGFSAGASGSGDGYTIHFRREAEKFFRPEFLARVDQFIAFEPLSLETIEAIARRELDEVGRREGMLSRDVRLAVDDEVMAELARRSFDIRYGARPLKRLIEQQVVEPLAMRLAQWAVDGPGSSQGFTVAVRLAQGPGSALTWSLEATDRPGQPYGASRKILLEQLDEVMRLRRRLYRTTYGDAFSNLEWQVSEYDLSSQSADFWKAGEAASLARTAEDARRIVEPGHQLEQELSALEDLATEAYHGRSFDIVSDIAERLAELESRIDELFMTVLRTTYERPDEIVLFVLSRGPHEGWRELLLGWYRQLARLQDWRVELWQPVSGASLHESTGPRAGWEATETLRAGPVAVVVEGRGARVLLAGEGGLHRMMGHEGNGVVEVISLEEAQSWPAPGDLEAGAGGIEIVRTWNFRTREVTLADGAAFSFDPRVPWESIWEELEELAWQRIEPVW
jgi:ATP-dependent Clp protease ATP-binding subunit ClpC